MQHMELIKYQQTKLETRGPPTKKLFLFCRLKPWHSQTGVAGHHLLQPRHLPRHIDPQNRHPHPSGRRLQHRRSKRQLYTPLPKTVTNSPSQTAVSRYLSVLRVPTGYLFVTSRKLGQDFDILVCDAV
jgi:hypothetical protein